MSPPLEPTVLLNKRVRSVRWSPLNKATIVECEDDSQYEAVHVICTVSLGVLRAQHASLFSPELPLVKRNAIEGLKLGTVNKIYVHFKSAFWAENWTGFSVIWSEEDLEEVRANPDERWIECLGSFSTNRYHTNVLCGWTAGPLSREMESHSEEEVTRVIDKWLKRFLKNIVVPEIVSIKR